jgi:hypothetical protein
MNNEIDMDKNKERDVEYRNRHLAMAMAVGVLFALTGVPAASAPGMGTGVRGAVRGGAEDRHGVVPRLRPRDLPCGP